MSARSEGGWLACAGRADAHPVVSATERHITHRRTLRIVSTGHVRPTIPLPISARSYYIVSCFRTHSRAGHAFGGQTYSKFNVKTA
jgi:hypothetical protein